MKKYIKYPIILAILCSLYIISYFDMIYYKNWKSQIDVNLPSCAADLKESAKIVVDNSGDRFYRVNQNKKIDFIQNSSSKKKGFSKIHTIAADEEENIYLVDIKMIESGRRIQQERIIKYSSSGKFEKVIYEINYETINYKVHINAIDFYKNKLYYFVLKENSFSMFDIEGNETEYFYPDAELMIVDFAINPINGEISFVDRRGRVIKVMQDGTYHSIYNIEDEIKKMRIPWDICYDKLGNFYIADIGSRIIYKYVSEDIWMPLIYGNFTDFHGGYQKEDIKQYPIYYSMDIYDTLITMDTEGICSYKDGNFLYEEEYSFETKLWIKLLIFRICILILILELILFFILSIRFLLHSSRTIQVISALLLMIVLTTVIFSVIITKSWKKQMTDEVINQASSIARLIAELLPKEELREINSADDYMNKSYKKIRDTVHSFFISSEEDWTKNLYYCIYLIQDEIITGAFSIEDYFGAIYPYDWIYENSDEQTIMESQNPKIYEGLSTSEGTFIFVLYPIVDKETQESVGLLEIGTDLTEFQKQNNQLLFWVFLNAIVVGIVVIMIIFEGMIFLEGKKEYKAKSLDSSQKKNKLKENKQAELPVCMLRIPVFLIFFVTNMTLCFFPLYIQDIVKNTKGFLGLSTEILIAIPMSAEVFFGALFSIFGGHILRILNRRKTAMLGAILFALGLFIRAVRPSIVYIIIGSSVMGAGWGILLLMIQVLIAQKEENEKNEGFTGYTAASFNGINSGIAFGAFLIDWMNRQMIFYIAFLISIIVIIYCFIFIKNENCKEISEKIVIKKEKKLAIKNLLSIRVISYFGMIVIPSVICSYFLSYLFPILGNELGISETNIGYAFLINGIIVLCLGKPITNLIGKKLKKEKALVLSIILYAFAFILYAYFPSILALIAALLFFGISDGFGLPIQASYYTDLKEVQAFGYEQAMGIHSLIENMSQTLGSYVFSYILIYGVKKGLLSMAWIFILFAILFMIISFFASYRLKK